MFEYNKVKTFGSSDLFKLMTHTIGMMHNEIEEIPMHRIPNKEIIISINFSYNKIVFIPTNIG